MGRWNRFYRRDLRNHLVLRRKFFRGDFVESRAKCPCELCQISRSRRPGALLYPRDFSGEAIRQYRRIPGFTTNFPLSKPR